MRTPRHAAVVPVPERNPLRNPAAWTYPYRHSANSGSESSSDASDASDASDGTDEGNDDDDSASAASSSSDLGDVLLGGEDAEASSDEESENDPAQALRRAYRDSSLSARSSSASSSLSFSFSSDDDTLDKGADFLLEKPSRRRTRSSAHLQSEPSMFPAAMRSDNVGVIAWLIPIFGVSTMLVTDTLACIYHFQCPDNFPTLSYAATFKPEGHVFTVGMCLTAIFIAATLALFYWFLKLHWQAAIPTGSPTKQQNVALAALACGELSALALFGLAVFDMRNYHDAHITFTIVFFAASWSTMVAVHQSRRLILRANSITKGNELLGSLSSSSCASISDGPASLLSYLRRLKRLKFATAYSLGKFILLSGLASTALFTLLFLCVNGVWPNPIGFTAVQEAFFEAFAIVCQLLFMGTISCELSMLTRLVERHDYTQLERAE